MVTMALDAEQKKMLFALVLNMLEASNPKVASQILGALDGFEKALAEEGLDWASLSTADKETRDRVTARMQEYMAAAMES